MKNDLCAFENVSSELRVSNRSLYSPEKIPVPVVQIYVSISLHVTVTWQPTSCGGAGPLGRGGAGPLVHWAAVSSSERSTPEQDAGVLGGLWVRSGTGRWSDKLGPTVGQTVTTSTRPDHWTRPGRQTVVSTVQQEPNKTNWSGPNLPLQQTVDDILRFKPWPECRLPSQAWCRTVCWSVHGSDCPVSGTIPELAGKRCHGDPAKAPTQYHQPENKNDNERGVKVVP